MTTKYEVQEYNLCGGWANNWHEYDDNNVEVPMLFDSFNNAELELYSYLNETNKAFLRGDIETDDSIENFRIVKRA